MENKYYQPEIEEFYVGFEFEIISLSSNNYKEDKSDCEWNNRVLKTEHLYSGYKEDSYLETVLSYLQDGHVRVKFLDEQDILDLDWENLKTERTPTFKKIKNIERLEDGDWCECILILRLRTIDGIPNVTIYSFNEHDPNYTVVGEYVKRKQLFCGEIKNKSELKKILKMLEI